MPTPPDLTAYSDLTLYDLQPADLVARAIADASAKLPEWKPVDGNTELVLMEAISLVIAELTYAVNRVPSATTMTLIGLFGIERSEGGPAAADVLFTLADSLGHDIPAGTIVRLSLGDDATLDFVTTAALSVAAGATTGTVAVQATTNTADANGITAGATLELISSIAFVNTVALATDVSAGADPESDEAWRDRAIQRFARLNETLVQPAHFTAEALTYPQVARATTVDNWDGTGTNAGHVTVAVLGSNGATISGTDKTAIAADLDTKAQANLAVHVVDPTVTNVDVTTTVHPLPGFAAGDVQSAVIAALQAYLNTDTWDWSTKVRVNELIAIIAGVAGVDYVTSLTAPAADVTLSGAAPLAHYGTLAVTVT